MPDDCGTFDIGCQAAQAVSTAFDNIAKAAGEAAGQLIGSALTWWINTGSVNPDNDTVHKLQQYTIPIAVAMLVGSILVQAIRMVVSRKKDPAVNVALGLIRYVVVTSIGLTVLAGALKAGDDWSKYLVDAAIGDFAKQLAGLMGPAAIANPFLLLITAGIACILAAIQWLLGFVRQAGILVLAVMLPLAASGSINASTKVWLDKLLPWLISLVLYKPMAAMIYAIGFSMMGEGQDFTTVMTGLMVMVLAVVAMPAMMRFFSWSQSAATGGSGAGGVLAAGATGAASAAAMRSARGIERSGPGTGPSGADPSSSSSSRQSSAGPGSGPSPSSPGGLPGGSSPSGATGAPMAGNATAATAAGGGATKAAAAAGPAGVAVAAAATLAKGAKQLGQSAADGFTDGGPKT